MITQDEITRFYDSFSRVLVRDFSYLNLRQDAVRSICKRYMPRGARVLEIGCGVGVITKSIQKRAASVIALDISPANIDIARRFAAAPNTEFLTMDILADPSTLDRFGEFDVVLVADVIEHVPTARYDRLFSTIERRLSNSGVVVMTYPTPEHQEYLASHEPGAMQVIDERVELDGLLRATELKPVYFQYKNIWRDNDYIHLVLSANRAYSPARLRRSLAFECLYRIKKYRWRFGNLRFIRELKRTLGEPATAIPATSPGTAVSEADAYDAPAALRGTHPGKQ